LARACASAASLPVVAAMRPSYYHRHYDDTFPGDVDVHGQHPRPRAHQFDSEPGLEFAAYVDSDVEESLMHPNVMYTQEFGPLARESAAIRFKLVARPHWLYDTVAADEYLLWWHRPRKFVHEVTIFPWYPSSSHDEFILFDAAAMMPVVRVRLRAFDQERGRAATGWAVVRFTSPVTLVPGIAAELRRVDAPSL